ncbi:MAG TPA: hypothetical protein ENJ53_03490 [Phaeodactylibacter sp.]|nr:hypothetical protein [Phaeodactylibacter sp.]
MQKYFSYIFSLHLICMIFVALILLTSCANQGVLSGGKKDKTPPALDSLKSTPNFQTNFQKQTIELTFDEWLQLNDVFKQVVVSPPLQKNFDVSLKKKTVRFKFDKDEILRKNATYTINFGTAIQDLNERNPVKDLRFVFSTGDFIDSLEVTGTVIDVLDKQPVKEVLVMLYDNLADTVVRKEKPFYFGKTDEKGIFTIKNVRADTFKVFALLDGNANYLFDNVSEKIGFLEKPIVVTDSSKTNLAIQLFEEESILQLENEDKKKYGRIAFGFNRKPHDDEIKITFEEVGQNVKIQNQKDSILLWYDLPRDTTWKVYVTNDTLFSDTIKIPQLSRVDFFKKQKLNPAKPSTQRSKITVTSGKHFSIAFNHPLEKIDTGLVMLLEDTLLNQVFPKIEIDTTDERNLLIQFPFKEKTAYQLQLLPNALTDFFGIKNDTITEFLNVKPKTEFGDLTLTVTGMQPDKNYVIELLDPKNKLIEIIPMTGDTIFKKVFRTIETGIYSVRMIEDKNGNGRWDTGNYDNKFQPEPLFTRKLEELRAGWELDASVKFN